MYTIVYILWVYMYTYTHVYILIKLAKNDMPSNWAAPYSSDLLGEGLTAKAAATSPWQTEVTERSL